MLNHVNHICWFLLHNQIVQFHLFLELLHLPYNSKQYKQCVHALNMILKRNYCDFFVPGNLRVWFVPASST